MHGCSDGSQFKSYLFSSSSQTHDAMPGYPNCSFLSQNDLSSARETSVSMVIRGDATDQHQHSDYHYCSAVGDPAHQAVPAAATLSASERAADSFLFG